VIGAALLLSRAHLERVTRVTSGRTTELTVALKRLPLEARARALSERAPAESVEAKLAACLVREESDAARDAALDELLAEIELSLESGASWPRAATRIAAYGGLLFAVLTVVSHKGSFGGPVLLVLGFGGAFACAAMGRRARDLASDQRKAVDALVDALVPRDRPASVVDRGPRAARRRRA